MVSEVYYYPRERKERGEEPWCLRALAEASQHAACPDLAMAEAHYVDALALAEKLGMRPLVAHCRAGLSNLYRARSQRGRATEELTAASTMYREMGMTYWLAKLDKHEP